MVTNWQKCIDCLQAELPSQQFNTWIRPLHAEADAGVLRIFAPNRFIKDWVKGKFLHRIREILNESDGQRFSISLEVVASCSPYLSPPAPNTHPVLEGEDKPQAERRLKPVRFPASAGPLVNGNSPNMDITIEGKLRHRGALNQENTFENFIVGKSNQLASIIVCDIVVGE